jgi:hypothetical protein
MLTDAIVAHRYGLRQFLGLIFNIFIVFDPIKAAGTVVPFNSQQYVSGQYFNSCFPPRLMTLIVFLFLVPVLLALNALFATHRPQKGE